MSICQMKMRCGRVDTEEGDGDDDESEFVGWGNEREEQFSVAGSSSASSDDDMSDDDHVAPMPSLADVVANPAAPMSSLADGMIAAATSTTTTSDNDMVVDGVSYKQRLVIACAQIGMKVGEKVRVNK
jgi:hypothetical protein